MSNKTFFSRLLGDSTATFVGFALTCGVLFLSIWLTNRNTRRLVDANEQMHVEALQQSEITGLLTGAAGLLMLGAVYLLIRRNDRHQLRASELVAEQKERLRTTLASIGDAVISTDRNGGVTYMNAIAESLTGWTNADAMGQPLTQVFRIVNESTRQTVENPAMRALKEGVIVGLANHTILIAKDGSEHPIDDSASPIRCKDEQIVGCVLVFRDVTERKREEVAQAEWTRLVALRADVSIALALAQTTPMALHQCCDALVRSLDVAFARIWMLNATDNVLELQASAGLYTHLDGPHSRVPVGQFKIGRIASTRQPHLSNSVTDDPNVSDREWAVREGMVAFAGYPLAIEGRVVGVMAIFARHTLSQSVLTELAPLANGIAQYIERRRLEEQAREEAELTRVTLASIGDAVISTDRNGGVTYMNAIAESLTGWTNADATGQPLTQVFRIVNESTRQTVENPAMRALKEGVIVGLANHTILIAKDDSERPIDDSASPIRTEDGEIIGCVLVFRDVTERKKLEKEQQEAQDRVVTTLESISDAFVRFDRDWRIVYVNREAENLTGRRRADLLGTIHWEQFPDTLGTQVEVAYRWAVSERVTVEFEHYFPPLGRWFTVKGDPTPDGGLTVYFRDITDHKQAEEAIHRLAREAEQERRLFDTVLSNTLDFHYTFDRDGRFTYANNALLATWKKALPDVIGKNFFELDYPLELADRLQRQIRQVIDTRQPLRDETNYSSSGVGEREYDYIFVPVLGRSGTVEAVAGSTRDITDHKRIEENLRASELRFRAAVGAVSSLIWTNDAQGRMAGEQLGWGNFTGQTLEEYQGYGWAKAVHPDDAQPTIDAWNVAVAEQKIFVHEHRVRRHDGEYRNCTIRAVPVFNDRGAIREWVGVHTDITDQKRDSEQLRRSEERLRRVFDAQSVGMIEWDLERNVVTAANEHFLNMVGYTADDVAAGRLNFRDMTPPEWTPRNEEGIAELRQSGRTNAYEKEYIRKDGSRVPILIAGIRYEDSDRSGMSFIVDLSDRKRAEKELRESEVRFRAMAENIRQLAWMARADGYIYWYNRRWYEYTGTRSDTQEGWGWESVHDPEVLPEVMERWKLSLATGEPFDMVFPLKSADGKFHPFLTRIMPVKDASGRVVQWFGTNTDISEQRALEEDLRKITAELSEADRRKDEFLATLAHELRNPLAPIRNGLQILRIADDTDTIERVRTMMERQLAQMVHLVDDLLDVSRISRGKLQLRKERIELATVLNDAVETSRPIIDAGGHTLLVTLPPEPITLDADATRLGQIFSNLLNNAAKYSERGGMISVVTMKDESGRLKVSITDTGVGIPSEMLPKIFEMFTQVDLSLEKSQGGLGIGLTLVKRLVEMHDGTVEARSEGHGKGSEFIVRLPIASKEKPMAIPRHDADHSPRATALKVLVADDNEDSAMTLSMILKILGSEVRTANDGMEAVEIATAFRPDVILLDIGMPRLNGYEACRRIREQPWGEKIVLVALTGWGQDEDKRRSQEAGFTHHVVKPVDPDVLKKLLYSRDA